MQKYEQNLTANSSGALRPLSGAFVTVTDNANGLPAALYSDNGVTPIAQPLVTDNTGYFGFYAADGKYTLTFSGPRFATFTRQILLEDPADNPAVTLQELALPSAAEKIGYGNRTVKDALDEVVSVRRFITSAVDGVTSNQDGIVTAVAHAYATGSILEWPAGPNYVSTDTIPHFHGVRHRGAGIVKRGANLWRVSNYGENRNTLFTSPNGAGDGLSANEPMGLNAAISALKFIGPNLPGLWRVTLADGTYTAPSEWIENLITDDYLEVVGPEVAGGVPTAVIDAGGDGGKEQALRIVGNCLVKLKDIKGINATATSVSSAFVADNGPTVWCNNVHSHNTRWAGANFNGAKRAIVSGGKYSLSTYGVRCYGGAVFTIGSASARTALEDCSGAGFIGQGSSYGHVDFCDFAGCGIGINLVFHSHAAAISNTFSNCVTAWQTEADSTISPKDYTIVGGTRRERSRTGPNMADDAPYRFETQFHAASGTNGRTSFGYTDWVVPTAKYQYSNNGTTAGFNLSGFAGTTALWESNGNTIIALAAPDASASAIWFGDSVSSRRGEIRQGGGVINVGFSGTMYHRFRSTDFGPLIDNALTNGTATLRWLNTYSRNIVLSPPASVTPANNGDMTFELTNDTTLKVKVKGSDGVVRSATLALA